MSMLDEALSYAARGWPVFPLHNGPGCSCARVCGSPGKHPRTRNGLKDSTTDMTIITSWWSMWPAANIALPTGLMFDALDVDGTAGLDSLGEAEAHGRKLPPGPTAATGGGYHLLFSPAGLGNRARFLPGCDWRGAGGYCVAPPSIHATSTAYRWLPSGPDAQLHPAPSWLREILEKAPSIRTANDRTEPPEGTRAPHYLKVVLVRELEAVFDAPEGTRNDQLNRSVYAVARFAELRTARVRELFEDVGVRVGLSPDEVRRTIQSAWDAR